LDSARFDGLPPFPNTLPVKLYYHPLSTYSQKVAIGFYEKDVPFHPEIVSLMDPEVRKVYRKIHPFGKIPMLLLESGWRIPESAIILEYLDTHFPKGPKLIPADPERARQARYHERVADLYLNDPISAIFAETMKPEGERDQATIEKAQSCARTAFEAMEKHLASGATYLMGDDFTIADCAAAPPLGYAKQALPFSDFPRLSAYFLRLAERPSYKRALKEALPYLNDFKVAASKK
jgi:glutathione S-transferase